jgi:streptogramin lyase
LKQHRCFTQPFVAATLLGLLALPGLSLYAQNSVLVTPKIVEYSKGLLPGAFPVGIAAGADGNVWFTDSGTTNAVGRITPAGVITEFTTGITPNSGPSGITAGPDHNMWFVELGDFATHPGKVG